MRRIAPFACGLYGLGVALLVAGMSLAHRDLVTVGGIACGLAMVVVVAQLSVALLRARRHPLLHYFQLVAGVALVLVIAAGVLLSLAQRGTLSVDAQAVLPAKIVLGIGGWLAVLVVGMSYVLMPMFTPTRARGRHLRLALTLLTVGFGGAAAALLAHAPAVAGVLLLAAAVGMGAFLGDVTAMARRAAHGWRTPVAVGQVLGALVGLVAVLGAATALLLGSLNLAVASVVLSLWGWLSLEIAANAVRLFPFMAWLLLPSRHRPRAFVPARSVLGWIALAAAGITSAALTLGILAADTGLVRLAGVADVAFSAALLGMVAGALRAGHPTEPRA